MVIGTSLIGRRAKWEFGEGTIVSIGYCATQPSGGYYSAQHHWRVLVMNDYGDLYENSISKFTIIEHPEPPGGPYRNEG